MSNRETTYVGDWVLCICNRWLIVLALLLCVASCRNVDPVESTAELQDRKQSAEQLSDSSAGDSKLILVEKEPLPVQGLPSNSTTPVSGSVLDELLDIVDASTQDSEQNTEVSDSEGQISPFAAVDKMPPSPEPEVPDSNDYVEPPEYDPTRQTIEIPDTWKRLSKEHEIWLDAKAKHVIIAGEVCLNRGQLEMFICPRNTKEHESVISANALASEVHATLISLGADPGKTTSWDPEYRAAYGPIIEIKLMWKDAPSGKTMSASAKQWVRDSRTKKALAHDWVFGGSLIWVDPETKQEYYNGDAGELVCLSNFETATIDLNIESSQSQDGLLFEAFTENIPPVGTKVYAVLKPGKRIEPKATAKKQADPETDDKTSKPNKSDAESGEAQSGEAESEEAESGRSPDGQRGLRG